MKFDPQKHHRRSIRLQNYDYTQVGAYFVTINTFQRECLFGEILNGEMMLSDYGKMVEEFWNEIPNHFLHVETDAFTVMPNHIHGIIVIAQTVSPAGGAHEGAHEGGAQHAAPVRPNVAPVRPNVAPVRPNVAPGSLGAIVRSFKSAVTKRINISRSTPSAPVWQRNYYEHVIRNESDLQRVRDYIVANPFRWAKDRNNTQRGD